jgi:sigma-E factor negative regulatory protein RseC
MVDRQSSCGSCAATGGCGTAALANWLPRRRLEFHVNDSLGLAPGERVVIGIDEGTVRLGALWLYAVPLLGMLAGGLFGEWLFSRSGLNTELGAIAFGLSGLAVSLLFVRQQLGTARWAEYARVRLLRRVVQAQLATQTGVSMTQALENTKRDRGT